MDGGKLLLGASDAFGDGSDDHWGFVLIQVSERGYPYELEEEDNGGDADANELDVEWEATDAGERGSSYAWGVMDELGDEDWFAVEVDDAADPVGVDRAPVVDGRRDEERLGVVDRIDLHGRTDSISRRDRRRGETLLLPNRAPGGASRQRSADS